MKLLRIISVLLALLFSLCGCALLPQEEEVPQAPLISSQKVDNFTLGYVQQGDLISTKRFPVTYSAVREEHLSFPVSGLIFKDTYVRVGDKVSKGDLLMELEQGSLSTQLTEVQNRIDSLHLSIKQAEQNRDLAVEQQEIRLSFIQDEAELEKAASAQDIASSYDMQLRELNDRLHIARMERDAVKAQMDQRTLRAGIDGTISYVRVLGETDLSVEGEHLITIADSASSMFILRAGEEDAPLFTPGMELSVKVRSEEYPVVVLDPAQLEGSEPEADKVYLVPDESLSLILEDGYSGSLELELDRRNDCLFVQSNAVKTMNGQSFVYYQDENGLRTMKNVVTGFSANGYVEIIEGLSKGEAYIIN